MFRGSSYCVSDAHPARADCFSLQGREPQHGQAAVPEPQQQGHEDAQGESRLIEWLVRHVCLVVRSYGLQASFLSSSKCCDGSITYTTNLSNKTPICIC